MFSKEDLRKSAPKTNSFVKLGTNQPEVATDVKAKERNKYLPVHLQEVRDEHGRKRLHGAFTGGYSAGYYNSVGSSEGWEPSEFKSSRNDRKKHQQSIEDFMDEDDKEEFGFNRITASKQFDRGFIESEVLKRKEAIHKSVKDSDNLGDIGQFTERIIDDLFLPTEDTIGYRLMRQMGWKEGQGLGPRQKRNIPDADGLDIYADNHLFAPKHVDIKATAAKNNTFGLGFDPHSNLSGSSAIAKPVAKTQSDKKSAGFSVGIFEDDDDYEVYSSTVANTSQFLVEDEEEAPVVVSVETNKRKNVHNISKPSSLGCIPGFHVYSQPVVIQPKFEAPQPPFGFEPKCPFIDRYEQGLKGKARQPWYQPNLTADQRRDILGEEALKGPTRSVFSYISVKDQDRLQAIIDKTSKTKHESQKEPDAPVEQPTVSKDVAAAALKGFMPFGNDLPKQERYKRFLQVKAGLETATVVTPTTMSSREASHEVIEFTKAALIYRPLSGMMATRFISAKDQTGVKHLSEPVQVEVKPSQERLKRTVEEWIPDRLICKRFNVPFPFHGDKKDLVGSAKMVDETKQVLNQDVMNQLMLERDKQFGSTKDAPADLIEKPSVEAEEIPLSEEVLEERPPMDLFKTIFASSDDEEEAEPPSEKPAFRPVFRSKADRASSTVLPKPDTKVEANKQIDEPIRKRRQSVTSSGSSSNESSSDAEKQVKSFTDSNGFIMEIEVLSDKKAKKKHKKHSLHKSKKKHKKHSSDKKKKKKKNRSNENLT